MKEMINILKSNFPEEDLIILLSQKNIENSVSVLCNTVLHIINNYDYGGVLIFTMGLSADSISINLVAQPSHISFSQLRKGICKEDDLLKLGRASGHLSEAPIYINDRANISPAELKEAACQLKEKLKSDLIIILFCNG